MPEIGPGTAPIKCILLATFDSRAFGPLTERLPLALLPLANQPVIGRIIGSLAALEIKELTVLASHHVDLLSEFLGDGSRWGCKIKFVSVANEAQVFSRLPELAASEFSLIGSAHVLPLFDAQTLRDGMVSGGALFKQSGGESSGWLLAPRKFCDERLRQCKSLDECEALLSATKVPTLSAGNPLLRCDSPRGLLRANHDLLNGLRPEQIIPGASAEAGIHISRNVVLHPTVRIQPPVVIGADCNIERGVHLGPNVAIGEKSILGAHTILRDAMVLPGTYIGPHLELAEVVADHNCLAYGDATGAVPVPDPFLLSASEGEGFWTGMRRLIRRVFAVCVLLPLWPLIVIFYVLGLLMGERAPLRRIDAIRIPAAIDPALWRTFKYVEFNTEHAGVWQSTVKFLRLARLPAFWNMACGNVGCFGIRPLTHEQVRALPSDWRQIYLKGTVGIIRLAELDQLHAGKKSDDQTYSSEAYYVATASFKNNLKILWRALWRK